MLKLTLTVTDTRISDKGYNEEFNRRDILEITVDDNIFGYDTTLITMLETFLRRPSSQGILSKENV